MLDLLPFDYQPLGRVIFEPGALNRLGEAAAWSGIRRALLVTDPGLEKVGHPDRALKSLQHADIHVTVFDGVRENPTEEEVLAGVEVARQANIDGIVAVGGGSSMDCAKGINFLLTNGGSMSDYQGYGKATRPMLPSLGVPTTAGTGSEAQSYALITNSSTHLKMACGDKKAAFSVSILDPELTLSQPQLVTAVTGIDALAHAIESYVCLKANTFSRLCSATAFRHLVANFEKVLQAPNDLQARAHMQLGAYFAGMAIENSMLGVCHSCANPLTAHYGITHGIAIGLMLPHVIRFNGQQSRHLYQELLEQSCLVPIGQKGGVPAEEILADRVAHLVQAAQLPLKLRECGVGQDILPILSAEAAKQWTARFNPRTVNEQQIQELYQAAW